MKKKILHPAVLFSLIWFVILLAHFIFSFNLLDELPPLSISSYLIFFIGVMAFSFGSFIETVLWQKKSLLKKEVSCIKNNAEYKISLTLRYI
ncbi:MAG: hypothetical protein ACRDE5_11715, partial [Ginsengibacter sp.]